MQSHHDVEVELKRESAELEAAKRKAKKSSDGVPKHFEKKIETEKKLKKKLIGWQAGWARVLRQCFLVR